MLQYRLSFLSFQSFRFLKFTIWDLLGGSDGKESTCNAGDLDSITGSGRSMEKGIATHFSMLAWRIS